MSLSDNSIARVAIAQINTTVGDFDGNTSKIIDYIQRARQMDADIIAFPELAVTGYPPEGILLKSGFVKRNLDCLNTVIDASAGIVVIAGFVDQKDGIFNSAAVIADGKLAGVNHKMFLSSYGVFDEKRYFQPGTSTSVYDINRLVFGVEICEDSWHAEGPHQIQTLDGNVQIVFVISASPFSAMRWQEREQMLSTRALDNSCYFVCCNLVGGQDELVFDGHSMIVAPDGAARFRGPSFEEALITADIDVQEVNHARRRDKSQTVCASSEIERVSIPKIRSACEKQKLPVNSFTPPDSLEEIYKALTLGVHDYVEKNRFNKVALGMSGGMDSALTGAIAVDALGSDRVVAVIMPSIYSSDETQSDAVEISKILGIQYYWIPIEKIFNTYLETLAEPFAGTKSGVPEENLQARARGDILMALSNKFGWLVLTTGNKSENAVGYGTLYGDMAGGLNVLKDIPKTMVYKLSNYRNGINLVIPQSIIDRAPSAELRPNQKDQDSLPPYEILDPIIEAYMEDDLDAADIVSLGFDESTVNRVIRMIDRSEYKRRQAPPGIKISVKSYRKAVRLPMTNRFHS